MRRVGKRLTKSLSLLLGFFIALEATQRFNRQHLTLLCELSTRKQLLMFATEGQCLFRIFAELFACLLE